MEQIINHILDNDLYKLSMQQAVIKKFPRSKVKYSFILRSDVEFPEGFDLLLNKQIKLMENLSLEKEQKKWLEKTCPFFEPSYLDFLEGYKYDSNEVLVSQHKGEIEISIIGYWYKTILWEVPLMALISELYFKTTRKVPFSVEKRIENNKSKGISFRNFGAHFADFGTRRRFSFEIQDEFVRNMMELKTPNFVGTSNVYLAYLHKTKPIGTHAHEWFMFHAAKYGYKIANKLAMENWTDVYRGDLGIALSDTFTTEIFFDAFDTKFAKLYDGVRQDSGDPIEFTDKVIAHYEKLRIDPKSKTIIFSDSLNVDKALEIKEYCRGRIKCSFGIGTNFTNDVGVKPLNMVIKMVAAKPEGKNWEATIKLSDTPGKHTGEEEEIIIAKHILGITS